MHTQFGDLPTCRNRATQTGDFLIHNLSLSARLFLLGFLEHNALIGVPDTLTLIRLWRTISTNLCSNLAYNLLVRSLKDDFRLGRTLSFDTFGQCIDDVVRKTKL